MNRKLIAAAVSAAVVAPVASQADITVYGRVNNAIDISGINADDPDTPLVDESESTTDVSNVSSRFGLKGSADLGNGMTAHGQYEFATVTDKEQPGIEDIRVATAGVSGAFGRIDVGNQWSSYYNTFGTLVSPTYSLGFYLYSSVGGAPYRSSNTIKYSNSFGPLTAQLDIRLNDSDETADDAEKIRGNGVGLGLSFAVNENITIAAAFDSEDGSDRAEVKAVAYKAQRGTAPVRAAASRMATADDVRDAVAAYTVVGSDGSIIKEVDAVSAIAEGDTIAVTAVNASADYLPAEEGVQGHAADSAPDTDRIGIAIKANFGGYWASLGWQNLSVDDDGRTFRDDEVDLDTTFLYVGGNLGEKTNWLIGYSEADDARDAQAAALTAAEATAIGGSAAAGDRLAEQTSNIDPTDDSSQLTWGVYHNMGGGLRLYYEATSVDSENNLKDGAQHLLGMRVDF